MNDRAGSFDAIEGVPLPIERHKVIGHDQTGNILSRSYKSGCMHHAWLLSGPKGIGKATFAYQFAGYMLENVDAQSAPSFNGSCAPNIQSRIATGAHPNIITASRPYDYKTKKFSTKLTVEVVRLINDFLHTTSGERGWRIIIVDAADDLNANSANALLKVLEEPPANTLFFILAHSQQGVLPTIRSRCQTLAMKPLKQDLVSSILEEFGLAGDMAFEQKARLLEMCEGSARRAIDLVRFGVVEMIGSYIELASQNRVDYPRLHQICSTLSPAAKAQEFELFIDMMFNHIWQQTRSQSVLENADRSKAYRYNQLWEQLKVDHNRVQTWNMDKKQLLLELFKGLQAV